MGRFFRCLDGYGELPGVSRLIAEGTVGCDGARAGVREDEDDEEDAEDEDEEEQTSSSSQFRTRFVKNASERINIHPASTTRSGRDA